MSFFRCPLWPRLSWNGLPAPSSCAILVVTPTPPVVDPIVITRHGRDRLVLLSVERYSELLKAASEAETAEGKARQRPSEDALRMVQRRRSAAQAKGFQYYPARNATA
jgi:PHD/YefM family antitoxin component YafN of YafNO toxin-antitoxin module